MDELAMEEPADMSFDEYRSQSVVVIDDKGFFDECDRIFGIDPETGENLEEE